MRADLYIESVLEKCRALQQSGIWAPEPALRPEGWLANFKDPSDRLIGAVLLDNFIFYSDRAISRLVTTSYVRLEDDLILGRHRSPSGAPIDPATLIFTPVEGEDPRPTDSGNTMCKRLRDALELSDKRFVAPAAALELAIRGTPIVFVDDIVGSGQQLINTWKRSYRSQSPVSFEEAFVASPFSAFCTAIVITETAIGNLSRSGASKIALRATHILDDSYSVEQLDAPPLSPPITGFQAALNAFLANHANQLVLEKFMKAFRMPLYGFHELGLLFAMQGSVPDCTLPLVWAAGPTGWIRLVRKNV